MAGFSLEFKGDKGNFQYAPKNDTTVVSHYQYSQSSQKFNNKQPNKQYLDEVMRYIVLASTGSPTCSQLTFSE